MITVSNLRIECSDTVAVRSVSFKVDQGEAFGIFGTDCMAKLAIVRLLATYTLPTGGSVRICGFNTLTHSLQARRCVGYLPKATATYSDMTVENYLKFIGRLHHVPRLEERIGEIVEEFDLADYMDTRIKKLSELQQRQVGIAQAIVHRPKVLILDEPTSGLEPDQIVGIQSLIKYLIGKYTIVLHSQSWSEAEQLCDRVLVVEQGRIADDYALIRSSSKQKVRPKVTSPLSQAFPFNSPAFESLTDLNAAKNRT